MIPTDEQIAKWRKLLDAANAGNVTIAIHARNQIVPQLLDGYAELKRANERHIKALEISRELCDKIRESESELKAENELLEKDAEENVQIIQRLVRALPQELAILAIKGEADE